MDDTEYDVCANCKGDPNDDWHDSMNCWRGSQVSDDTPQYGASSLNEFELPRWYENSL